MTSRPQPESAFTLAIDGQEILVRYRPHHIGGFDSYAMLEFTCPHDTHIGDRQA